MTFCVSVHCETVKSSEAAQKQAAQKEANSHCAGKELTRLVFHFAFHIFQYYRGLTNSPTIREHSVFLPLSPQQCHSDLPAGTSTMPSPKPGWFLNKNKQNQTIVWFFPSLKAKQGWGRTFESTATINDTEPRLAIKPKICCESYW